MASIFTKIINREIPAYIVAEDDHNLAFLDINPLKKGHTLVIPKIEVDELYELPNEEYTKLMDFGLKVAQGIKKAIPCKRIGSAVLGMEVPHAHVHLVPLDQESDLSFSKMKLSLNKEEMAEIANKIKGAIQL